MILFLTAIDPKGQHRDFSCQLNKIEQVFDFLTGIVARGDTLLNASLLEKDIMICLPLDAFDQKALDELEAEWQGVLRRLPDPASTEACGVAFMQWTQRQINRCQERMVSSQRMVSSLRALQQRAEACASPEGSSSWVSLHFATVRGACERQLLSTQRVHKAALTRLSLLQTRR